MRAQILEKGGPKLWSNFTGELRHLHLGAPRSKVSIFARLQSTYEIAIAERDHIDEAVRRKAEMRAIDKYC